MTGAIVLIVIAYLALIAWIKWLEGPYLSWGEWLVFSLAILLLVAGSFAANLWAESRSSR